MTDKDKQQTLQNLAAQMQVAQDTIKQVESELKKLGVDASELPNPKNKPWYNLARLIPLILLVKLSKASLMARI